MEDRVSIHFSVEDGIIEVEQKKGPLISRKEISRDQLLNCFRKSVYIREDAPPVLSSGFLPLNTLAVRQTKESVSVVVSEAGPHMFQPTLEGRGEIGSPFPSPVKICGEC